MAGGAIIWILIHSTQPLWWNVAWGIGYGQAVLAMAVLIAAQLAVGRVRRDAMADLYASFPAPASTRVLGQLAGLAGAVPASLVLVGGTVAAAQLLGPVGVPGLAPLAAGLLLVIAAGAAGIAVGTRFPHPLAGVLGAIALFVPVRGIQPLQRAGQLAVAVASAGRARPAARPAGWLPARRRPRGRTRRPSPSSPGSWRSR